jgi:excisionase family DNA binding protein
MLTIKQAAERAAVSAALVYEWCDERRLPHYRVGGAGKRGKILIELADLDAFLASLKVDALPAGTPAASSSKKFRHLAP